MMITLVHGRIDRRLEQGHASLLARARGLALQAVGSAAPRGIDDDVHTAFADVVLVASADPHRNTDDPKLRVTKAERHGTEGTL